MTAVQLALDCDPDWADTPALTQALARIELQQLGEPANPNYKPRRRARRRIRTIRLASKDYL